ncbi:hypothetical protein J6590_001910 [Homalodisca vitripennis]|nr:hypothetical protein J6590_001910 [Homalodisca vitripennis]
MPVTSEVAIECLTAADSDVGVSRRNGPLSLSTHGGRWRSVGPEFQILFGKEESLHAAFASHASSLTDPRTGDCDIKDVAGQTLWHRSL